MTEALRANLLRNQNNLNARSTSQIWEPTRESAPAIAPAVDLPEQELVTILTSPLHCDESHATAAERRELEVFQSLSSLESFVLYKRLAAARQDDPLTRAFSRFTPERRYRLLRYLGDPKRRASLGR